MNLKVISFNILCADAANGNSIIERAPRIRAVVAPLDADLIGFQEATPAWLELLERDYGEAYEIYNVYRGRNSHESTPIAWKRERFACLDKGTLWLSDTPEVESPGWDERYGFPRIFTWARLKEKNSGTEFCLINTHFGFGDHCQTKSAQILLSFIRRAGCPCVVTGDFNMEMDSAGYQVMTEYLADVNAQTVNDLSPTYHGFDSGGAGEHIDYCFVTRQIRPLFFRIISDLPDGRYPSDHYGIFASLSV